MDYVHADEAPWVGELGHRSGGIGFKLLLTGEEARPGNFQFALVKVDSHFETPRHRHNFDQVRILLSGQFGFGDQVQQAGTVGYFGEGTYYEQRAEGPSLTLLLQTENASRARYISRAEMEKAIAELSKVGSFSHGVYTRTHAHPGAKTNQDGYEAVWEYATGQKIAYARPRYDRPIISDPRHFEFVASPDAPGVAEKCIGSFSERRLTITYWKMEPGSQRYEQGQDRTWPVLGYVTSGQVDLCGTELRAGAAFKLNPGERSAFSAREASEIIYIDMPR